MPNNQSSSVWKILQDDVPHPLRGGFGWPRIYNAGEGPPGGGPRPEQLPRAQLGVSFDAAVGGALRAPPLQLPPPQQQLDINNNNYAGGGSPGAPRIDMYGGGRPNANNGVMQNAAVHRLDMYGGQGSPGAQGGGGGAPMMNGGGGGGGYGNQASEYARQAAWSAPQDSPQAMAQRLPPLQVQEPMMMHRSFAMPEQQQLAPQRPQLEPIHLAGAMAAAHMAQASSNRAEERLILLEQRTIQAERASSEVGRAFDMQNQRMQAMNGDLSRGAAEVNDLRMRYEQTQSLNGALQQQVSSFAGELRNYDGRLQGTSVQLSEALRINADMRGHMLRMGEELSRGAHERATMGSALERMGHSVAVSTQAVAEDSRRALEEANAVYRLEAGRRQEQHLGELAALNRDVGAFRQEAAGAGAMLHATIERLNARLHSEEAQLDRVRQDAAQTANAEAAQLGNVKGQVGELQNVLNAMNVQLQSEQGARRQDAAAFDGNLRAMEAAMLQAQDTIVKRTITMMEGKSAQFMRLFGDLDTKGADRDEETRTNGEQQLAAFVKGSAKKERAGLERILVLESAMRDVAAAAQMSLNTLNDRINSGMTEVSLAQETARRANEEREAVLRDQINAALQKIRAYARDMEESLEQERCKLEEVVKMEIKARMSAMDTMKEVIAETVAQVDFKAEGLLSAQKTMLAAQRDMLGVADQMRIDLDKVQEEVTTRVIKQMLGQVNVELVALRAAAVVAKSELETEAELRKKSDDSLGAFIAQTVVEAKHAEEALHHEIEAVAAQQAVSLENEMKAIYKEVDKLHAETAAEVKEREHLGEQVKAHGEVFVDVQRKLESQDQKTRTCEVQLAALYEQAGEKFTQLEERDAEITQELAKARKELITSLDEAMVEQDAKAARNQSAVENVMAQIQEEVAERYDDLISKQEAQERLMEDEGMRLEQFAEDQAAKVSAHFDEALAVVAEETDARFADVTTQLTAAGEQQRSELAAAEKKQSVVLAAAAAEQAAALSTVSKKMEDQTKAVDAAKAEASAALATAVKAVQADIHTVQEGLDAKLRVALDAVEENRGALVTLRSATDAGFEKSAASIAAEKAATQAGFQAAATAQQEEKARTDASFNAAAVALQEAKAAAEAGLAASAQSLAQHQAATSEAIAHQSAESSAGLAATNDAMQRLQASTEATVGAVSAAAAANQAATDEVLHEAQMAVAQQKASTDASLASLAAVTHEQEELKHHTEAALAANVEAMAHLQSEVGARLADSVTAVADLKHEVAEGLAANSAHLASHVEETGAALQGVHQAAAQQQAAADSALAALALTVEQGQGNADAQRQQLLQMVKDETETLQTHMNAAAAATNEHVNAAVAELQTSSEALRSELHTTSDALRGELQHGLQEQTDAVSTQMHAQQEAMDKQASESGGNMTEMVQKTAASLAAFQEESNQAMAHMHQENEASFANLDARLVAEHADTQAAISKLDTQTSTALTSTIETLSSQMSELRGGEQGVHEQLVAQEKAMHEAINTATTHMTQQSETMKQELETTIHTVESELTSRLEQQSSKNDQLLAATAGANKGQSDDQYEQLVAKDSEMAEAVAALQAQNASFNRAMIDLAMEAAANAEAQHQAILEANSQMATVAAEAEERALSRHKTVQDHQQEHSVRMANLEGQTSSATDKLQSQESLLNAVTKHESQLKELTEANTKASAEVAAHVEALNKRLEQTHQALMITAQSTDAKLKKLNDQQKEDYDNLAGATKGGGQSPEVLNSMINSKIAEARMDLNRTVMEQINSHHEMTMDQVTDYLKTKAVDAAALAGVRDEVTKHCETLMEENSRDTINKVSDVAATLLDLQLKKFKTELNHDIEQKVKTAAVAELEKLRK